MNSILYHQKITKNSKGQKLFIGEDARPFAMAGLIAVADGLGGRGGYPHTGVTEEILNRDGFFDLVFAPVFEYDVSDEFREMLTNSFEELFATRDYYFSSPGNMRTSGYFASRLALGIALYELKYNPDFDKDKIFSELGILTDSAPAEEESIVAERAELSADTPVTQNPKLEVIENVSTKMCTPDEIAQKYADKLAALIKMKLGEIAEVIGLEVETRVAGAYLLPTTMNIALINERDDSVDVLYLWAGDSRAYFWNTDGLAQLTEDHEDDEAMTNLINLTSPFKLEARLVNLPKPCILFNATDGCYKCPCFESSFDLEYIFLQSVNESRNFDEASRYLASTFSEIGRHDDSNTMALATFGYDTYEDVKEAVQKRLGDINDTIIARLPGILEISYPTELAAINGKINEKLYSVKDSLIAVEAVAEIVENEICESGYLPYVNARRALRAELSSANEARAKLSSKIKEWIEANWLKSACLKRHSTAEKNFKGGFFIIKKNPYDQCAALIKRLAEAKTEYSELVASVIEKLNSASKKLGDELEGLLDIRRAPEFKNVDISTERNSIGEVLDFFKQMSRGDHPAFTGYMNITREINALNASYVENDKDAIESMLSEILAGTLDLSFLPEVAVEKIRAVVSDYAKEGGRIDAINGKLQALPGTYCKDFWELKFEKLMPKIWSEHEEIIPNELKAAVAESTDSLVKRRDELRAACELREEIYSDYNKSYNRYFRGSRL